MAPSRAFRPTRRDFFVACISAAVSLLWFQATQQDAFSFVREHEPWPAQAPLDAKPEVDLYDESPIVKYPTSPSPHRQTSKPIELMPSTTMIAHGDGWTLFDNLYMFNGTLLVVSDEDRDSFPEKNMITSTGKKTTLTDLNDCT